MNAQTFKPGTSYLITTEKVLLKGEHGDLYDSAPWDNLIKMSTYAVRTTTATPKDKSWEWVPTADPHIASSRSGRLYLLCTLDKGSGIFGSSEFADPATGEVFEKGDIARYIIRRPFEGDTCLTIPLDTIRKAQELTVAAIIAKPSVWDQPKPVNFYETEPETSDPDPAQTSLPLKAGKVVRVQYHK